MSVYLQMEGPFALDAKVIDECIRKGAKGNYALGYKNSDNAFAIKYVGRSDSDLNSRLKAHIGEYNLFKFSYADSAIEAYKKECKNYHDCGCDKYLDNKIHPDKPDGSLFCCCPICKQ